MRTLLLGTLALPFLPGRGSSFLLRPTATTTTRHDCRGVRLSAAADDEVPTRKRRWRRRKPGPAVVVTDPSQEEDGRGTAEDSEASPMKCPLRSSPFSATLPRHRIDVRGAGSRDEFDGRRRRRLIRGVISPGAPGRGSAPPGGPLGRAGEALRALGGVLGGVEGGRGGSAMRGRAERLYPGVVWWELEVDVERPLADEDIAAQAAFWRAASDLARGLEGEEDGESTRTAHLALSGIARGVAGSLCDILNWHARWSEGAARGGGITAAMRAELVEDDDGLRGKVAVVRFTGRRSAATADDAAAADGAARWEAARPSPPTAEETELRTRAWVNRVLVRLGVCPFTKSAERSGQGLQGLGVPVAGIMYRHSDAEGGGPGVYGLLAGEFVFSKCG